MPPIEHPEESRPETLRNAKIQAALKIIEWSRDSIEPGIGGNPHEFHEALALAFQKTYRMISEVIDSEPQSKSSG